MRKKFSRVSIGILILSMVFYLFPATAFAAGDVATDIKYSMSSDDTLDFDEEDFNDVCDDLNDEDLDYVEFDLPDDDEGVLYYNYDEDDDSPTEVSSSKKYYYSSAPYISKITFVPDEDYSDTLTVEYEGYDTDGNSYSGEIKIVVSGTDSSNTITYSVEEEEAAEFDEDDFNDACNDIQDEDLDYVKFSLPDEDDGVLYYDYDEDDSTNTEVTTSKKYYYEDASPYIKNVSFVPEDNFSGSVTIKYTGYDVEGDSFAANLKITVGDDSSSDEVVTYKIDDSDEVVDFDEDDFDDVSNKMNKEDLKYIKLSLPAASKGVLYYDYSDDTDDTKVSASKSYYADSSPYISKITFVPDEDFSGTCKISFTGYDVEGDSFSGTISITVGGTSKTAAAITYAGKSNTAILFKDEDFNKVCKSLDGNQLSYITFTLPSASSGILYYGYTANGSYTSKVKASTQYYYGKTPYLMNVSFVPEDNVTGTVTISYTGYDSDGLSYTGKVQISVTAGTATIDTSNLVSSKYFKDVDISYSWAVPFIDGLYEAGVISGTTSSNGTKLYNPAANVTRGDFMLILYNTLKFQTSSTTTGFSDVPSSSYYYKAITTAKALGIAQGADNKFNPDSAITREDAMVMVLRAINITGKTIASGDTSSLTGYADGSSISDYSKSAVAALVKAKIVTGSDDNKIYPQGNLTRAQVAAIISRVKAL